MTGYELAVSTMDQPSSVSIRLNPFKRMAVPDGAVAVPWCEYGYLLPARPCFTLDPYFHAGAYYVQDSSAMFVGWLFRHLTESLPERHLRVLDLCAAPGGKTTDIAASLRLRLGDSFTLVANEVMGQRARILSDNVAVWGDPNVLVTCADPKAFAAYSGWFDVIIADVPCSGYGVIRKKPDIRFKDENERKGLPEIQLAILRNLANCVKDGGELIYSTCTVFREENEDIIRTFLAGNAGFETVGFTLPNGKTAANGMYTFFPHVDGTDGFFVCKLRKVK